MPRVLNPFDYSPKGAAKIAELKGKNPDAIEQALGLYLRNQSDDSTTALEIFHFLMFNLIDLRQQEDSVTKTKLTADQIDKLIGMMKSQNQFFGYNSGSEFFQAVDEWTPSIFAHESALISSLRDYFPVHIKEVDQGYNFPVQYNTQLEEDLMQAANRCDLAFNSLLEVLPVMQKSHRIKEKFHAGDPNLTKADLTKAKDIFEEYRGRYQGLAGEIAQSMPFVHGSFQRFQANFKVHMIYNQYLAKLLASREARFPVEDYVLNLAKAPFNFTEASFTVDEQEEYRGITVEQKKDDYQKAMQLVTNRLESRYKKRKLMAALQTGTPPYKILKNVVQLCESDPEDIKTHILAARMFAEQGKSMTNTAKRVEYRERALSHCKEAFSRIDAYLDLQGMQDLQERDRVRVGFVKTISSIRNPLIRGS